MRFAGEIGFSLMTRGYCASSRLTLLYSNIVIATLIDADETTLCTALDPTLSIPIPIAL